GRRDPRPPPRGRNALRPRPAGSIVDPEVRRPLAPAGAPALVGHVATPATGMPAAGRSHPSLPNVTTRGEGGDVVTDREQTSTGSHVADRPAVGRGRGGAEAPVRRDRSEERRVGKGSGAREGPEHRNKIAIDNNAVKSMSA